MTAAHGARLALQRLGIDVARFPASRPEHTHAMLLRHHRISTVVDVGANAGQYGSNLRRFGYSGRLISFEPLTTPFQALDSRASRDASWECHQLALGAEDREIQLNVAGNDGASSSVLGMLDAHAAAAPTATYTGKERVRQRRLDRVLRDLVLADTERILLKVDVQGYEEAVLDGLGQAWTMLHGLQLEMSLVPLYEGGLLYRDALERVLSHGFELQRVEPGFTDARTGQMLQFDGVFFRTTTRP